MPAPKISSFVPAGATLPSLNSRPMRVDVNLVLVPVTVVDAYNQPVTNLPQQNFTLLEGGTPQQIRYFTREDGPISVALILDFSGSMNNKHEFVLQAVEEFFQNANPEDDYYVIAVSDRPMLVADASQSENTILAHLAAIEPHGMTALYDSIYLGVNKLRSARYKRRAMVIVSDGGDNRSRYTLKEIKSVLAESDVLTYSIGLFDDVPTPAVQVHRRALGPQVARRSHPHQRRTQHPRRRPPPDSPDLRPHQPRDALAVRHRIPPLRPQQRRQVAQNLGQARRQPRPDARAFQGRLRRAGAVRLSKGRGFSRALTHPLLTGLLPLRKTICSSQRLRRGIRKPTASAVGKRSLKSGVPRGRHMPLCQPSPSRGRPPRRKTNLLFTAPQARNRKAHRFSGGKAPVKSGVPRGRHMPLCLASRNPRFETDKLPSCHTP